MAGTIVTDRIESDASYASSVNIASPLVIANTISLGSSATITGNVNIDNGTLFVNQNNNRVGIGGITNPSASLDVAGVVAITENSVASANSFLELYSRFSDNQRGYVVLKAESNSSGSSDLVIRSRNNFSEAEKFRIDSVGRITIPNQPLFHAYSSNGNGITTSGVQRVMPYANVLTNNGGFYSTSTNRFTAPVAGRYMFSYNALLLGGGSGNLTLFRNGSTLAGANGHARAINGTNESCLAQSVIVTLAANDYVEVYYWNDGGGNQFYGAHGAFCGTLLG